MIRIYKLPSPVGLRAYLADNQINNHTYDAGGECFTNYQGYVNNQNDSAFIELRKQLLREQKYVCCYCGQQIRGVENENGMPLMKTEHFLPKNANADRYGVELVEEWRNLQLEYRNLLAACLGNSDSPMPNHCDSSKGNHALLHLINPANPDFRNFFEYRVYPNRREVTVHTIAGIPNRDEIENEINDILNLNEQGLRQRRFNQWNILITNVLQNRWTRARVQECYNDYSARQERHVAFSAFILGYLSDKLTKMS